MSLPPAGRLTMNHDAVIIGAGPAGSSAAITLARQGWAVALIERTEFPRRKVCGEFISATNLALLDRLGVGDAWRAAGRAGNPARRLLRRRRLDRGTHALERRLRPRARARHTRPAAARCGAVGRRRDLPAMARRRHCARRRASRRHDRERTRQEKMLRAPVIIAAHGSWEPGKLPSQLDKINKPSDLLGFKAHFRGASLPADLMPLLIFPGGYGGMVSADHGRLSLSCCIRRDTLAAIRAEQGKRFGRRSRASPHPRHLPRRARSDRPRQPRRPMAGGRPDPPGHPQPLRPRHLSHRQHRRRIASDHRRRHLDGDAIGMASGRSVASRRAGRRKPIAHAPPRAIPPPGGGCLRRASTPRRPLRRSPSSRPAPAP